MFTYLEELTVTEAEQVRKTIQALFRQTCILQVKYDPATLTPRDNPQYELCARHRNFIADYVEVLGCELVHDAQQLVCFCRGKHGSGLVKNKNFGITDKGLDDFNALLHTNGQVFNNSVGINSKAVAV